MRSVFYCPVFNQAAEFPAVLAAFKASAPACDTLLLVNNGSHDGSETLVRGSGLPYLDIPRNLGVGYSYMVALDWALARGYDVFGTIASNGKMLVGEMGRLLEPIRRDEADYVTGSRFLPGGDSPHLPRFRRWSIPAVNRFVRLCTGVRLTDATCGYRAFRLEIMRRAEFDWHQEWLFTYGLEYYLYAKVLRDPSIRTREVPITMRYPPQGRRYSKIRPGLDWYQMLKPYVVAGCDGRGFAPRERASGARGDRP